MKKEQEKYPDYRRKRIADRADQAVIRLWMAGRKVLLCDDNRGMGVVEVILIILVLVGLVVVFKNNITTIVNNVFKKITTKVNSI